MQREEVRNGPPDHGFNRPKRQSGNMRQPTTLRGVFPDIPVVYKRNFIKENVRRIKQLHKKDTNEKSEVTSRSSHVVNRGSLSAALSNMKLDVSTKTTSTEKQLSQKEDIPDFRIPPSAKSNQPSRSNNLGQMNNISHRSMQTEVSDDLDQIYSTGIIKYPTSVPDLSGDCHIDKDVVSTLQDQSPSKSTDPPTNFIRNNILALTKPRPHSTAEIVEPTKSRNKSYKVPKWKKEAAVENIVDEYCPPGHVLLPEEERRATLRVLQENYAQKIQELNLMPVRSDTLKMQRRKIGIENELKKIDEGIKVFQRPKVYVKIDA